MAHYMAKVIELRGYCIWVSIGPCELLCGSTNRSSGLIIWRHREVRITHYTGALIVRSTEGLMIWKNGKQLEYLSESKERNLRTNGHCFGYLRFAESDSFRLEIQPIRDFREWDSDESDFCTLIVQPICNFRNHTFNR